MSATEAIRQYENLLTGKSDTVRLSGSMRASSGGQNDAGDEAALLDRQRNAEREKDALAVIRYAVKGVLGWEPQKAMDLVTPELYRRICLVPFIKYLSYPPDISRKADLWYPIHRAFPDCTYYNPERHLLSVYHKVESGELAEFLRYLFSTDTEKKLCLLLRDYVSRHLAYDDIGELYARFNQTKEAHQILKQAKLIRIYPLCFETPLEYLHESLGREQDGFLYGYYQYARIVKATREQEKEIRRKEKIKRCLSE